MYTFVKIRKDVQLKVILRAERYTEVVAHATLPIPPDPTHVVGEHL